MLIDARINLGKKYSENLKDLKGLILPLEKKYAKNVYWMYAVVLDNTIKLSREKVMIKLKEKGIETRSFFIPMHKQPAYYKRTVGNAPDCKGNFPVADFIGERGFYLPSSSNLTDNEMNTVVNALKEILNNK